MCHVSSLPSYALDVKVKYMNFGVILMSILSSFAYEIWYIGALPCKMCFLSLRPSCDLDIAYRLVFMVLNANFNNTSVISWRSVLLVQETEISGESGENQIHVVNHWQPLSHDVVLSTPHNVSDDRYWLWLVINPTTTSTHIIYDHNLWSQGQVTD